MKKQGQVLSQSLHCSLLGLLSFVTSILILTFSATFAHSAEVTVAWDPNTEPDLAGYKIYYKTESSGPPYNGTGVTEGDSPIDVGNQTEFTFHGLTDDVTYFLVVTAYNTGGLESDYSEELIYEQGNHPPVADAGPDQTVPPVIEGETVTLDGTGSHDPDSGDGIASYLWKQTGGISVTLSDTTEAEPTFVTPPVDITGTTLTFQLTVTDNGGLESSDEVSITIDDNGITDFAEGVVTTTSSTNESIGIKEESGGDLVSLEVIDPSTIADTTNRPEDLVYGLINMQIKAHAIGGSVLVTMYLPEPAPDGYKWYKYGPTKGWYDYSSHAVFNIDRTQVTLTLTDGGIGDDDDIADGMISDPSGLGIIQTTLPPSGDDGGVFGCFIATAAYGSRMANEVVILRNFRDNVLLQTSVGRSFVKFYYEVSPPLANYIRSNKILKVPTRLALTPVIYGIKYPKTFVLIFLFIVMAIPLTLRAMKSNRF
jgi:hypothetical protein